MIQSARLTHGGMNNRRNMSSCCLLCFNYNDIPFGITKYNAAVISPLNALRQIGNTGTIKYRFSADGELVNILPCSA